MPKYETTAGLPTRGETYVQLHELLIRCQELAAMMGHLHNTEGSAKDRILARGWLATAEMFRRIQFQIAELAKGTLQ